MESVNLALNQLIEQMVNEKIAGSNERLIRAIDDRYVRPLQESRIIKKVAVAKMLNVSPFTVTQLIDTGCLKTTADGRVTEYYLRQYLAPDEKNSQAS